MAYDDESRAFEAEKHAAVDAEAKASEDGLVFCPICDGSGWRPQAWPLQHEDQKIEPIATECCGGRGRVTPAEAKASWTTLIDGGYTREVEQCPFSTRS